MTKHISTLVRDIYDVLEKGVKLTEEQISDMGHRIADTLSSAFGQGGKGGSNLRMSSIGQPCARKLWYTVNKPELQEALPGHTLLKFAIGHIIEEVVLTLAEAAGHEVKGKQDELEVRGIKGHRDAIIDGHLVDVKSANSRSFNKFKFNKVKEEDSFGYMSQLGLYHQASKPDLKDQRRASFLGVDKELGYLALDTYEMRDGEDLEKMVAERKIMVQQTEPPDRHFSAVPDGKSGNMVIPMPCRYCAFKDECWKDVRDGKGLEKVVFANGPRWYTRIEKQPKPKGSF